MTEYTWTFDTFEVALSEDGLTNVVKSIIWTMRGKDDTIVESVTAKTGLDNPDPNTFVDFNSITEEWTVSVITSKVDIEEIKKGIQAAIDRRKEIVRLPAPFSMPQPEQNANN